MKIQNRRQTNIYGMKRMSWRRMLLAVIAVIMVMTSFPAFPTRAQTNPQIVANLVVFVKYKGDERDVFNAVKDYGTYKVDNWQEIKKMYNCDVNYTQNDISFRNYITEISEGKVEVINYFPQEETKSDGTYGVKTLELSRSSYDTDSAIVKEVVEALQKGTIKIDTNQNKLDNRYTGMLDNLTIVVQGKEINGDGHAFRSKYSGTETFGAAEIGVTDYNMIPSDYLVKPEAESSVSQQQGVIAHEFLHTMGLADLYQYNGSGVPVGLWDVMAANTSSLQYPLSYFRAKLGWIPMETVTKSGTYTLSVVSEKTGNRVLALKTPLSDSELICLEYRVKGNSGQFEHSIPSSGLLMYRVDTKVDGETNAQGKNYVYVYRPGVTDPEAATDTDSNGQNLVRKAALNLEEGETEYGSTDLSADFTQNTLYYSDGRNSGIRISNLVLSQDKKQVTFTVTFANYADDRLWEKLGDNVSTQTSGRATLYVDPNTGDPYVICPEGEGLQRTLVVKRWNGNAWAQVGNPVSNAGYGDPPALAACGGELYLAYIDANSQHPVYCKLSGGTWSKIAEQSTGYPMSMQLIVDNNELYAAYQEIISDTVKKLVIWDIKNNKLVTDSKTASDFGNPVLCKTGGLFYMAYTDFGGTKANARVETYNPANGQWNLLHEFSFGKANEHQLLWYNNKLYVFAGNSLNKAAVLAVYDGNTWTDTAVSTMNTFREVSLNGIGGQVYLSYYDQNQNRAITLRGSGQTLEFYNDTLGTGLDSMKVRSYGNVLYAVTKAVNSQIVAVRKKEIRDAQEETPPQEEKPPVAPEPLQLRLTPPTGYGDSHIFIDGIEYTAVKEGSSYHLKLPDTTGKTAVMYAYNASGVPVGMYVWKLTYQGQVCTATPLPGLQDLLSYHGFSIRVQSPAGIRFKSGVDTNTRKNLIGKGVDGYRLVEYGTLFITNENRRTYPFILGGTKVGGGRAYWTENGKVNDKIFETVAGRIRFTSVLINLSPNMYATDIAFRSYMILENNGERITVYGPPVYRSVYTVAKQIQQRGEFPRGSAGYQYVQGIINSVEGK